MEAFAQSVKKYVHTTQLVYVLVHLILYTLYHYLSLNHMHHTVILSCHHANLLPYACVIYMCYIHVLYRHHDCLHPVWLSLLTDHACSKTLPQVCVYISSHLITHISVFYMPPNLYVCVYYYILFIQCPTWLYRSWISITAYTS